MDAQAKCRRAAQLQASGDIAAAERLCLDVLAEAPDNFTALHLLGVMRAQQGRKEEARDLIGASLKHNSANPAAAWHYGLVLQDLGRPAEALASFDHAIALKPDFTAALYDRANLLRDHGQWDQALASYDKALALQPDHIAALNNRAGLLRAAGRFTEALADYDRALTQDPGDAALWRNRGNLLRSQGHFADALAAMEKSIAANPGWAEAWDDHGAALWELGRIEESAASCDRAIAADPNLADAWFHKAFCRLAAGQLAEGWPLWRWRKKLPAYAGREFSQKSWTGDEDLAGKTLFVWWEEGLGDTIHFFRYAGLAAARGARVIAAVPEPLAPFLAEAGSGVEIIGAAVVPPHFDYQISFLDLPEAFRTRMVSIPAARSYLRADPARVAQWAQRIGKTGFRVGVVWATTTSRSFGRSYPLAGLAALAKFPGVRLISLQQNDGLAELDGLPPGMAVERFAPGDFRDTAAMMENMDLIISADSAPAHLAGALGRPVWLVLKRSADWRWFQDREDSPWYPSMRLFRQARPGDWDPVFAAMAAALARLLSAPPPML